MSEDKTRTILELFRHFEKAQAISVFDLIGGRRIRVAIEILPATLGTVLSFSYLGRRLQKASGKKGTWQCSPSRYRAKAVFLVGFLENQLASGTARSQLWRFPVKSVTHRKDTFVHPAKGAQGDEAFAMAGWRNPPQATCRTQGQGLFLRRHRPQHRTKR